MANIERTDTLRRGPRSADLPDGTISQPQAAELLNVSERTVRDAKLIASRMANMERTDTLKRGSRSPDSDNGVSLQGAADLLNVGRATVADAKLIDREAPGRPLVPLTSEEGQEPPAWLRQR